MGGSQHMWPLAPYSNLVTVEQGTFRHSSTLPVISMDFQKDKKKTIDTVSQIGQPWPARGGATEHRPAPWHRLPTLSSTVSSKYHIHQNSLIRIFAFQNHHNLLPFDTRPRNGGAVQPIPRVGTWTDEAKKRQEQLNLQKKEENSWR